MQRNSAVVDIPLLIGVSLLVGVEVRDIWRVSRMSKVLERGYGERDGGMEIEEKELDEVE